MQRVKVLDLFSIFFFFYLDVFPLPFALASRERAFVVGGVRAERAPHAQPAERPEKVESTGASVSRAEVGPSGV